MDFIVYLDNILRNYGIDKYELHKLRSVYRVSSKYSNVIVKKFNSNIKLNNTLKIISYLKNNSFNMCQDICLTKNKEQYCKINGKYYACFSFIDGREVNFKNHKEVKKCIKSIYSFHKVIKNLDINEVTINDNSNWIKNLNNDLNTISNIKDTIIKKKEWNIIDKFYYENIDTAIKILYKLLTELNDNDFINILSMNKMVCHNSLYYQNLILNKKGVHLIDFGGVSLNHYVHDLSRLARRVFYKNGFDVKILNMIYKTYNNYYRFSDIDKRLFKISMTYPYKFIKIGYKYYIQNKNLKEEKLISKLIKYSRYELGK